MELTPRQEKILEIVKKHGPITGEQIAELLNLTRATLRPDLSILTMAGFLDARPRVGYFYAGRQVGPIVDEMKRMKVGDYKAVPVMVSETTSAYEAIVNMFVQDVGTLFVTRNEDHSLAGIISRKDLLRSAMGKQNLEEIPVSIIMTRMPNLVTCRPEETLLEAANKLIQYQVDCLPVVRPMGEDPSKLEVIGRITKTTITRAFTELGQKQLML